MPRSLRLVPIVLVLVAVVAAPAGVPAAEEARYWREDTAISPAPELVRFNTLLADLAEQLKPALVHIRSRRAATSKDKDDEGEPRRSSGSGFLIDPNGLIVTNAHVVEDADYIQVRLADGRRFTGKVIGQDARVDLALVRIEGASNLPTVAVGDSNRLRVGEFVMALGHPFGLEQSVSFGIVSRKGSPLTVAAPGFDFIQTDAAINPGNSGGPLVNMSGQVIGINSSIRSSSSSATEQGGSIGLGFAIPMDEVLPIINQLRQGETPTHARLGVSVADNVTSDSAATGALVKTIEKGGAADDSGIRVGDVITKVDKQLIDGSDSLVATIRGHRPGDKVTITLIRGGKTQTVTSDLGSDEGSSTS